MLTGQNLIITVTLAALWSAVVAKPLPFCQDGYIELKTNESREIYSDGYPYGFEVPSGCQRKFAAPIYHYLEIDCHLYVGVE